MNTHLALSRAAEIPLNPFPDFGVPRGSALRVLDLEALSATLREVLGLADGFAFRGVKMALEYSWAVVVHATVYRDDCCPFKLTTRLFADTDGGELPPGVGLGREPDDDADDEGDARGTTLPGLSN